MAEVSTRLGIPVTKLRALRTAVLAEGPDFRFEGSRTLLTPAGVEKLRGHLGLTEAPDAASLQDTEAVTPPKPISTVQESASTSAVTKKARVISIPRWFGNARQHYPNAAVIRVEFLDEPGVAVFARVRHSQNYAPRLRNGEAMILEVGLVQGRWEALGRAPRFPGRW
jgi:hypothetical protein